MNNEIENLEKDLEIFVKNSNNPEYVFNRDDQFRLERIVNILNNQINILIEYEIKRQNKQD